jgi:hypothetical protein
VLNAVLDVKRSCARSNATAWQEEREVVGLGLQRKWKVSREHYSDRRQLLILGRGDQNRPADTPRMVVLMLMLIMITLTMDWSLMLMTGIVPQTERLQLTRIVAQVGRSNQVIPSIRSICPDCLG